LLGSIARVLISDCMPPQRALSIAARRVAASSSVGMITDRLVGSLNSAFTLRKIAPRHRNVARFLQAPLHPQHGHSRFNMANVTFDTFKKLVPRWTERARGATKFSRFGLKVSTRREILLPSAVIPLWEDWLWFISAGIFEI
jgi:hypothetical protein